MTRSERQSRSRSQWFLALVVVAVVVAAGVTLDQIGPRPARGAVSAGTAPSGVWFCPHGGGDGWTVTLSIANPGNDPVQVRVSGFGESGPAKTTAFSVAPGTTKQVAAEAGERGSSSMVEFFGGWVAAGWVSVAGGKETGVAAEPCMASAGSSFLLPDNTTSDKSQNAYVVVMNPFNAQAVVSLALFSEKGRVQEVGSNLSEYVIKAGHSHAFRLNDFALDDTTLATRLDVNSGRVAAATLGISSGDGGIRSADGVPAAASQWILPGGKDNNKAALAVLNTGSQKADLSATLFGEKAIQTAAGANGRSVGPNSAATFPVVTTSPSTIVLKSSGGPVAAVRRTFGPKGDEGATGGVPSFGTDWVVLPAVGPDPAEPRLLLSSTTDAKVTLTLLGSETGLASPPQPVTVSIPASRTVLAPIEFTQADLQAAVLVHADTGSVVPAFAAYSQDEAGYAVSAGVQIP